MQANYRESPERVNVRLFERKCRKAFGNNEFDNYGSVGCPK